MTAKKPLLSIQDLHAKVEDKEILKGVNLEIFPGEIHAIMGRNGSGKSTLSYTLMGHPRYTVTAGKILFKGEDIVEMSQKIIVATFSTTTMSPVSNVLTTLFISCMQDAKFKRRFYIKRPAKTHEIISRAKKKHYI